MKASVIIVSRGRPEYLRRALVGVGQLWYGSFEIVVVADPKGCGVVREMGLGSRVKLVPFDQANISEARNHGIAAAAGEILAFIDDDAVPEPGWLTALVAPFQDPEIVQVGGLVLGRNGITPQWPFRTINALGETRVLPETDGPAFHPGLEPGEAAKTEGTNMAFRRESLVAIGGFDPAFRFFLDESDVNLRLRGQRVLFVPDAVVHHGFAASTQRRAHRGVADLTEIGASTAVYMRKHAGDQCDDFGWNSLYSEQRKRLITHMIEGRVSPDDVNRILVTLRQGFDAGLGRAFGKAHDFAAPPPSFLRFDPATLGAFQHFAGRVWQTTKLRRAALEARRQGKIAMIFRFSPTALSHRLWFHPDGYWEQSGGLFGRSDRDQPWFRWYGFQRRVAEERARVSFSPN